MALMSPDELVASLRAGDRRALARVASIVERGGAPGRELSSLIFGDVGRAHRVGITGPPGAGKSTLTARLTSELRRRGRRIGVVAVDPSSPFSGGALLGDRTRMNRLEGDPGVFVRSLAARGALGGLASAAEAVGDAIDAAGFDVVIFETVGVGQSELDVAIATDSVVVVTVPEGGDGVQAMKAGLMEIADLFVLNKADRPGAREAAATLRSFQRTQIRGAYRWDVPLLSVSAADGTGISLLADALAQHRAALDADNGDAPTEGTLRRRARYEGRVEQLVENELRARWRTDTMLSRIAEAAGSLGSGAQAGASPEVLADEIVRSISRW